MSGGAAGAPRYQWLAEHLRQAIAAGTYCPGDLLPTEHALMAQYQLSSTTVRRALRELEGQGWIYRRAGKGTFVRRAVLEENLIRLSSFAEEMQRLNLPPAFRLLHAGPGQPPPDVTAALDLPPEQPAYHILRLQLAAGQVIALSSGWWQLDLGQRMAAFDLHTSALYELVEQQLGVQLAEADETILALAAGPDEAAALDVPPGSPLLARRRITYTAALQPVEFSLTLYPSERYSYRLRLLRH